MSVESATSTRVASHRSEAVATVGYVERAGSTRSARSRTRIAASSPETNCLRSAASLFVRNEPACRGSSTVVE